MSFNRSSQMSLLDKTWFGGEVGKFFGSPAFKLARKDSPQTSKQAALLVNTTSLEQLVYETIGTFPNGCIQDEVLAKLPGKPYSSVTARFKSLLEKGYIEDTGLTRAGNSGRQQRVLKVKL
jgi:hypothetical protein